METSSTGIVLSNTVIVSDPVYEPDGFIQLAITMRNIKPGAYKAFVWKHNVKNWGRRVAMLTIVHHEYVDAGPLVWRKFKENVDVDTGQAGFFSPKSFHNTKSWFHTVSKLTVPRRQWGTYATGVVASSGLGDGSYPCYVARHNRKIIAMCIDFCIDKDLDKNYWIQKQ